MSRHTWMDRTIEATREADVPLPWSRKQREEAPEAEPKKAAAQG